jgi:hypothetical protein
MIQPGCAAKIEGRSDTSPHNKAALRRLQSLGPEGQLARGRITPGRRAPSALRLQGLCRGSTERRINTPRHAALAAVSPNSTTVHGIGAGPHRGRAECRQLHRLGNERKPCRLHSSSRDHVPRVLANRSDGAASFTRLARLWPPTDHDSHAAAVSLGHGRRARVSTDSMLLGVFVRRG